MEHIAGVAIDITSVAGIQTCIQLPGLRAAVDMGTCPRSAVARPTVFFTHAHIDHMGAVAHHVATRSLTGMSPPTYVVPPALEGDLRALLDVWRRLDGSDLPCQIIPLPLGGVFHLGKGLRVRPFRAIHRAHSQGYIFYRRRTRLRADLVGRSHAEIADARARGESVSEPFDLPEVAVTGDTCVDVIEREPDLRRAKVLIMELTFLDDRISVAQARNKGHTHLDEVIERAALFENQAIVFTHLSARYSPTEVRRILDRRLPDSLRARCRVAGFTETPPESSP